MKKAWIILLGTCFCFVCSLLVYAQSSLIETIHLVNDSIVTVKGVKSDGNTKTEKTGAGVIVHPQGLIITNLHTVALSEKIYVVLSNQKMFRAKLLKYIPINDLALLQISTKESLTPIVVADSNKVKLGDRMINIGHSTLLNHTITEGLISRLATKPWPDGTTTVEYIQVNMNLYKGDSGGPLLDDNGYLVGMVMGRLRSEQKATIAIPSNKLKDLYLKYVN